MTGATIGPYRVVRELGQGGMGTVVLAEDTRLGRHVALKTVSGTQAGTTGGRAQLLDEARAAAAISHPAIAGVYDVVEHDGDIAIVFEYVEGETLAARLAKGPLPEDQALRIAVQLADALGVAHGYGILHRDLKPSNIMLAPGGAVKILDFGIARFRPKGTPATGGDEGFMGTPGYVAPEQWVGKPADERSDLYALGVVLFEMVSGKRPFPEREPFTLARAAIDRIARRLSSLVPNVSPGLDKLVARLLAADPALRPPKARVVADELRALLAPPPVVTVPWRRWVATVAAVLAVAGGAAWWLTRPVVLDVTNPVIGVLPFANATGDGGNDYLAAGVADSLATSLASLPTVTVVPRARIDESRTGQKTPGQIAGELGATFVVDGRVENVSGQLRLVILLLKPDGSSAWSEDVEGPASGVFDMQARLASALGAALQVQMSPELLQRLNTPPSSNGDALDAYWRGRALLDRRDTPGNLQRATVAFNEALRKDVRFVKAHAALGEAYAALYAADRVPKLADQAIEASRNALQLAPDDIDVRVALGFILVGSGRHGEAVQELQRVLAVRPNHDEARRYLARALAGLGKLDESVSESRKALALRPNNWQVYSDMGVHFYRAARYAEARQAFETLIEMAPDNSFGYQQLGAVYQALGDSAKALEYAEKAASMAPSARAYSNIGAMRHAREEYDDAIAAYQRAIELAPNLAATHRNLGDTLLKVGRAAAASREFLQAVALAESVRQVSPGDVQNLASLAIYLQKAGNGADASLRLEEALRLAPNDVQVWYCAAIVHALAGRRAAALDAIQGALDRKFPPASIVGTEEFDRLRHSPRFRQLVGGDLDPTGGRP